MTTIAYAPADTTAAAVLVADTRTVLVEYGWNQGRLVDDDGTVCLLGALNVAAALHPTAGTAAYALAVDTLALHAVGDCGDRTANPGDDPELLLPGWNDIPGRTLGQVLDLLDATRTDLDRRTA